MRPRVIIHNQISLDGRMDWLPIDPGLYYEIAAQYGEDATLAGTDTLLTAIEEFGLDVASEDASENPDAPLLVVPDSRGRLSHWQALLATPYWSAGVALCSKSTPDAYFDYLESAGVNSVVAGTDNVDLATALEILSDEHGLKTIRVDSGGTLNGALLRGRLVDEVSVLISPFLVGGTTASSLFRAQDLSDAEDVIELRLANVERLRDDVVWLRYEVDYGL